MIEQFCAVHVKLFTLLRFFFFLAVQQQVSEKLITVDSFFCL